MKEAAITVLGFVTVLICLMLASLTIPVFIRLLTAWDRYLATVIG